MCSKKFNVELRIGAYIHVWKLFRKKCKSQRYYLISEKSWAINWEKSWWHSIHINTNENKTICAVIWTIILVKCFFLCWRNNPLAKWKQDIRFYNWMWYAFTRYENLFGNKRKRWMRIHSLLSWKKHMCTSSNSSIALLCMYESFSRFYGIMVYGEPHTSINL